MRYTPRVADKVFDSLETVVNGLAMRLVEISVSKQKGGVQVRAVVYRDGGRIPEGVELSGQGIVCVDEGLRLRDGAGLCADGTAAVSINDCARVHRAILPRLEIAFPGQDIRVEVSSPGIERRIKDGAEFVHYIGRPVSCYLTGISAWTSGILISADDTHIVIKGNDGMTSLSYDTIAKAKLACLAPAGKAPRTPRQKKGAAV
ncbi:MAG: ribosome assembly cofactor RimP [Spirochaetaceae bacterium]|jgi:ribosome maturation factor RimP|nr:ribosome assembly cofactor RimP [Spirochaetaceae bacterium]